MILQEQDVFLAKSDMQKKLICKKYYNKKGKIIQQDDYLYIDINSESSKICTTKIYRKGPFVLAVRKSTKDILYFAIEKKGNQIFYMDSSVVIKSEYSDNNHLVRIREKHRHGHKYFYDKSVLFCSDGLTPEFEVDNAKNEIIAEYVPYSYNQLRCQNINDSENWMILDRDTLRVEEIYHNGELEKVEYDKYGNIALYTSNSKIYEYINKYWEE